MEKFLNLTKKRECTNEQETQCDKKQKKSRKYDESYLDFGFTCTTLENEQRPKCVICLKVLAADSMIPNKLKRHLETNHPSLMNKQRNYFVQKLKEMNQQQVTFKKQVTVPEKSLLASYKVAYLVAKNKKPHTIAETLILPAALEMVSIMLGEPAAEQLKNIPLSDNTIGRRISDIAEDINDYLVEILRGREFALQLDEATDNHNDAHLICYVRFIDDESKFYEDLLFCRRISMGAKATDLFNILNSFVEENNIDWEKCIGICTDGGRSMSGCYTGLQALIRKKSPNATWTHCIIHREALIAKNVSPELNQVIESVIQIVNYIKTRPHKARFFQKICEDMGSKYTALLFYCNSRWLSRGNVLKRVFELRNEIFLYLLDEKHPGSEKFTDQNFVLTLAYLCDIFDKLNALNLSLQGNETSVLELHDKIQAFRKKLLLWRNKMAEINLGECFPTVHSFLTENEIQLPEEIKAIFIRHLSELFVQIQKYFPEDEVRQHDWVKQPFTTETPVNLPLIEQEQYIDISSDSNLRNTFFNLSLLSFWTNVKNQYPEIATRAFRILTPFATSYLCEAGFSVLALMKTKYRSRLNVEKEMRVSISKLLPRFEKLMKEKQAHCSH